MNRLILLGAPLLAALIFVSASSFALHDKVDHAVTILGIADADQPVIVQGIVTNQAGELLPKVTANASIPGWKSGPDEISS